MFYLSMNNFHLKKNTFQHYFFSSYANTHSEHNACASQTTRLREGSRSLIKKYVK
jgi:selenocysteine lyase/cysteine desulfurase